MNYLLTVTSLFDKLRFLWVSEGENKVEAIFSWIYGLTIFCYFVYRDDGFPFYQVYEIWFAKYTEKEITPIYRFYLPKVYNIEVTDDKVRITGKNNPDEYDKF